HRQRLAQQRLDLEIRRDGTLPVQLRADLDQFPRRARACRPRVEHAAAITEPRDSLAVEQVRIDARNLRRDVGANAERSPGELIHQLEGLEVEVVPGT